MTSRYCALAWSGRALAIAACLILTACAGYQGVEEFEAYRSAFEKTYGTSTSILDQLAVQERAQVLSRNRIDNSGRSLRFNPDLARYYTDAVDPPGTAAFRHSLDTVKAYNDVLYGLASGQTAATLSAKVATLNGKIADAANEAGSLVGIANQAELKALGTFLNGAYTQVQPLVQLGLAFRSRDEFRQYAVEYHEPVRSILVELRRGTAVIFPILTNATLRRSRISETAEGGKLTQQEIAKLEAYRKLLADWVILIDASIKSLDQMKAAVDSPPTISGTITGLTKVTTELETASQSARKHLAELTAK